MIRTNKVISIILLICMMVTMIPTQAYAEEVFTVDYTLTNVTVTTAPSTVTSGTAINATIIANEGYELPDAIGVNGLYDDFNYEKSTGDIEITNVQSNIEIVAEGVEIFTETLDYSVNYYMAGNLFAIENITVLVANPKVENVSYANKPTGYKLDETNSTALPFTVPFIVTESENVINVYYIADEPEVGTVILNFIYGNGYELLPEDTITDLELGEYTFNAPIIEGYTADFNSETVTIEHDGQIHYIVFTYTENEIDFTSQLRVVYADCQDIQDEEESLDIFVERSLNEEHNIMKEVYYDLTVGENIITIPKKYNDLELQFRGKVDWDSEIHYESINNEQEKIIKIYLPYLTSLNYYAGYVKAEPELPIEPIVPELPEVPEQTTVVDRPKKEDNVPSLKDIKQEDFIARWLEHKPISKELKKFYKEEVKFEISIAEFKELKKEGLEPRVYKWNKEKGKLIAETTVIEEGTEVITIKHPTVLKGNTNNYYAVFAVNQPKFEDVNKENSNFKIIDKANGLGIIEGIEKDSKIYFEADKEISKSAFYTIIARIFGAMPEGEMKMYDILDFKTVEEANEILDENEIVLDDWAKPYVASLLEQGYIVTTDLKDNRFNFCRDFNLVEKLFKSVEIEKNAFNLKEGNTREAVIKNLIEMLENYGW